MGSEIGPPPPPPPPGSRPARYAYLVGRLRNRQITMDEATELFALQQATLARAVARAAPPAPEGEAAGASGPAPAAAGPARPAGSGVPLEDALPLGLLGLGVGAGLLAALLKRARDGPPATPTGDARSG